MIAITIFLFCRREFKLRLGDNLRAFERSELEHDMIAITIFLFCRREFKLRLGENKRYFLTQTENGS